MSLQDLYYNLRRRERRSNESFDENLQRRSAINEADRLKRARKRSDQLSQRKANRVHSQIEVNIPECSCGIMSENYSAGIEAKNYRQNIQEYNAALAFASMGAEIKAPSGTGPFCFSIHGQIYHMVSSLCSNKRNKPDYGQLYIFDSSEASNRCMENNQACLHYVMEKFPGSKTSSAKQRPNIDRRRSHCWGDIFRNVAWFAVRNAFSILHNIGKLFEQYIVDAYGKPKDPD
ncbi:hypothetical protein AVEN_19722-1 [Araneus ventricosus]|uniref:Helitron helicase-like domain-containing protein n=1 Tax=Araneus ventricosus TaxID=182803 RepID=A0A4Y2C3G9_ARAVE|nr:hypothetical protein AVEN_19722-1 [Araneus ventricosus]